MPSDTLNLKQNMKLLLIVFLTLSAFAGNSILARLALDNEFIDPYNFTFMRMLSGALVLLLVHLTIKGRARPKKPNWNSSISLFTYALTFSMAYLILETGFGALILFTSVKATLILVNLFKGERINRLEWFGLILAFMGFVYLINPSFQSDSFTGIFLMAVSGMAWGMYTYFGRTSINPIGDTYTNFFFTLPFSVILILVVYLSKFTMFMTIEGFLLSILSGGLTSALGYIIWYKLLPHLSGVQSAGLQLLVPIFASIGGLIFVNETISNRLIISSFLILGGIMTMSYFKNKL